MAFTWLHLSDFHVKEGDAYDRDVVLKALVDSVRSYRAKGRRADLLFATGDIGHSGKPGEYAIATRFFDDVLDAAGLDRRRLFVIPGNHDVDRDVGRRLERTLTSREDADDFFAPAAYRPHLTDKQRAFWAWYDDYFAGIRAAPRSSCAPAEIVEGAGCRIAVWALNSALFCQGDDDHAKLWLGRRALEEALEHPPDADLRVALIHHPLDWLSDFERANIRALLGKHVDVLLRGHLHETDVEHVVSAQGQLVHLAAGAAYQTRRWPNRAMYVTVDGGCLRVFPIRYEDSASPLWTVDPSVFPDADEFTGQVALPFAAPAPERPAPEPAPAAAPPAAAPAVFRSNIPSRRGRAFVGREGKLDGLLRLILEAGVVVISGPPGVGKSELALELARQHRASFPGGTFRIDATSADAPVDLARIGVTHLGLEFPPGLTIEDQCDRVLTTLAEMSALLVYDNVRSFPAIERWLPPDGMPCRVAITSVAEPRDPGWTVLLVEPLTPEASVELVEALAGAEVASDYGAQLAASSGGLPVELCPAAAVLAYERRRGRQAALPTTIATPTRDSFTFVYEHLEAPARLLLHAAAVLEPQRIVRAELQEQLATALDWSELDFRDALDACLDLHVIQGDAELTMHQLFSAFVRDTRSRPAMEADVQAIRKVQREHLLDIAERLVESPVDAALATSLLGFGLDPAIWQPDDGPLGAHDAQAVGRALNEIGQFDRARPWFEHAVDSIRRGRPDGPIDHEELSKCLHSVGHCHLSVGQFEAARPWFEEAVEETRLGDLDGNVDHDSLGRSLHSVGYCFANLGQFELARPWYEESVEEKRKGDLSGRIDHRSLGASIHAVAYCCLEMGDVPAARDWYEQAVEEKKGGDAQGRVDHASIGNSMQQLGVCLAEEGDFEQARQWFERAVEEQRHGDVHGRVDHDRLGLSLFSVGHCFVAVQDRERARDRYLEAVEEMVKGDIHGRVDHDAVGRGLHEIGSCYEDLTEARRWLEQAIEEKGKGDVHGRVSWDSLGLSLDSLARCLSAAGDHAAACARFKEAVEAQRRGDIHGRVDHDGLRSTLAAAAESCRELGDEAQAAAYEADAAELAQA